MAQIESTKKIDFNYQESTASGRTQPRSIRLYTVFDSELKTTFVYEDGIVIGARKPLATIGTDGKVIPFQENGRFIASNNLRFELQNNQSLITNIKDTTRDAVRRDIGLNNPSLIANVTPRQIDQAMGTSASGNNADPAAAPPAGAAPSATPLPAPGDPVPPTDQLRQTLEFDFDNPIQDGNGVRPNYGGHIYPQDLVNGDQDYIKFAMYRYKPKGLASKNALSDGINKTNSNKVEDPRKPNGGGKGYVILPIQSPAGDSNTVGWSDGSMSGIDAAMFNVASIAIKDGLSKGAEAAGNVVDNILSPANGAAYRNALGLYFAQQAAQINGGFARATGAILNPNLELLFQAPQLRTFNFTFKLSARDEPEATEIRKIIRFFKQGMSVKKAQPQLFLKTPDVFDITYYKGGTSTPHKSLNRFKTCALQAFNVDYTPLGSYMTYADNARTMVAYTITMQFQEIDPIYDDDYNMGQDEIGY